VNEEWFAEGKKVKRDENKQETEAMGTVIYRRNAAQRQ
jgi:hypothetical protein